VATRREHIRPGAGYAGGDGRHVVFIAGGALHTDDGPMPVPAFFIDRDPVSNADYARFVEQTGHASPPGWDDDGFRMEPHAPVVNVGYEDAEAYARWACRRLPTPLEWQRAARGRFSLVEEPEHNSFGMRGFGEVWEWTDAPSPHGGRFVCGGPSRGERHAVGRASNLAWEDEPAPDVGFRLAADRDDASLHEMPDDGGGIDAEPTEELPTLLPPVSLVYRPPRVGRRVGPAWIVDGFDSQGSAWHSAQAVTVQDGERRPALVEYIGDRWAPDDPRFLEITLDRLGRLGSVATAPILAAGLHPGLGPVLVSAEPPGVSWSAVFARLADEGGALPVELALEIALDVVTALERLPFQLAYPATLQPRDVRLCWSGETLLRPRLQDPPAGGAIDLDPLQWAPPEVLLGMGLFVESSLVFTAARITHELLCAPDVARAWSRADNVMEQAALLARARFPALADVRPDVGRDLAALVDGGMKDRQDARVPADIRAFRAALESVAEQMQRVDRGFVRSFLRGLFPERARHAEMFAEEVQLLELPDDADKPPLLPVDPDGAVERHAEWLEERMQLPLT
jgi:hypothetical protein